MAELRSFDIHDGMPAEKPGFLLLKDVARQAADDGERIRVMVAGGDGTVMWVISELTATGVDVDRVVVGHIPFGTGNDFSRSTGWGGTVDDGDLIGTGWKRLKRDVKRWLAADDVDLDVWEVEVTAASFAFVHHGQRVLTENDKVQHRLTELDDGSWDMRKPMVNYFSLGQCNRAGLGVEKRRSSMRLGNILRYGIEGLKGLTFRPAPMVSDVVKELSVSRSDDSLCSLGSRTTLAGSAVRSRTSSEDSHCSSCSSLASEWTTSFSECKETSELLFLNVPSFAGGATPWAWSTAQGEENAELNDVQQDMGDGRLEVVSYKSAFGAAIDATNSKFRLPGRGSGQRVASAEGPFRMSFLSPEEAKYTSTDGRVYLQVDGEFFVAHWPQTMQVHHSKTIKVLRRSCQDTGGIRCAR